MSTATKAAELLYVHSVFHPAPECIPMGVPGLINSVECRKKGLFSYEVTAEDVKKAAIVALDLHWHPSLWSVQQLAAEYKAANPGINVVVGGYTATIFAKQLVAASSIDYVIRGDAEVPFKLLVESLLGGDVPSSVPNLTSKNGSTPLEFSIDSAVFSQLDYSCYEWFPTLLQRMSNRHHEKPQFINDKMCFPFIPIYRGCPYNCESCYGSPSDTRILCGRSAVSRSADSIARDLTRCSDDPRVPGVAIVNDFMDFLSPEYKETILSREYDLQIYYEFYNLPEKDDLQRLCDSFQGGCLNFPLYLNHGESETMADVQILDELCRTAGRYPRYALRVFNPRTYYGSPLSFERNKQASVLSNEAWHVRVPEAKATCDEKELEYRYFNEHSRLTTEGGIRDSVISAMGGVYAAPEREQVGIVSDKMDRAEQEKRLRGCLPRYLIQDVRGCFEVDDERERYERWVNGFVSKDCECFTLESGSESSENDMLFCRADTAIGPLAAGPLNLGVAARLETPDALEDILMAGTGQNGATCPPPGQENTPISVLEVDGCFSESAFSCFEHALQTAQMRGYAESRIGTSFVVADTCRWFSKTCPALRLERAFVGRGKVKTCVSGPSVRGIGDSAQSVLRDLLEMNERCQARRRCSVCEAAHYCPRCMCLGSIPEESYCTTMRRYPALGDLILIPQAVNEMERNRFESNGGTSRRLLYEITNGHRLFDHVCESLGFRFPHDVELKRILKDHMRLCILDDEYFLFDMDALHTHYLPVDAVLVLAAMRQSEISSFDDFFSGGGRSADLSDVARVVETYGQYLQLD